jgi:hypothetical protein
MCVNCGCDCAGITLPFPEDGVGVSSVTLNGSNQFVFTFSNGTSVTTSAVSITDSGSRILHNDTTSETTDVYTPTVPTTIGTKTYTIPSGTLTTDGSEIRVTTRFKKPGATTSAMQCYYSLYINNAWFCSTRAAFSIEGIFPANCYIELTATITRTSNTAAVVSMSSRVYDSKWRLVPEFSTDAYENAPAAIGSINFTTTGIDLAVKGLESSSADVNLTCEKLTVEYIKK